MVNLCQNVGIVVRIWTMIKIKIFGFVRNVTFTGWGTLKKYQRRQNGPIYGLQKYKCTKCGRRQ